MLQLRGSWQRPSLLLSSYVLLSQHAQAMMVHEQACRRAHRTLGSPCRPTQSPRCWRWTAWPCQKSIWTAVYLLSKLPQGCISEALHLRGRWLLWPLERLQSRLPELMV